MGIKKKSNDIFYNLWPDYSITQKDITKLVGIEYTVYYWYTVQAVLDIITLAIQLLYQLAYIFILNFSMNIYIASWSWLYDKPNLIVFSNKILYPGLIFDNLMWIINSKKILS